MQNKSGNHITLNLRTKGFLEALFKKFEEENIKYCVLHSYEKILDEPVGDIDFAIDKKGLVNLWKIIKGLSKTHGIVPVQKTNHDVPSAHKFIFSTGGKENQPLALDFVHDDKGINACLFNTNDILKNRRKYKDIFYIPAQEDEFVFYLIKKIHKGCIDDNKKEYLRKIYFENPYRCKQLLSKYIGIKNSQLLINIILKEIIKATELARILQRMKKSLWVRQFFQKPQNAIIWAVLSLKRICHRVIYPQGLVISFISPDGGGKSTLANEISNVIGWAFDGRITRLHWRPGLLPFPYRLLQPKRWNEPEPPNTDPHGGNLQSPMLSLLRFLYYTADYLLGYVPKIWWPKVRFNLVILERYYYDFIYDRRRFNLNLPDFLPRFFMPLIPKVDLLFFLNGNPEDIYSRKKELSLEAIKRQLANIKKLTKNLDNVYEINVSRPLPEVVEEVRDIIIRYLADRLWRWEQKSKRG